MSGREPMNDSSSDGEDLAKFQEIAVSAGQLEQHAERSKQVAQQRQARARQRRAGGGGILGAAPGDSSGDERDESVFLDAAQLKVAEALQKRLQAELEMDVDTPAGAAAAATQAQQTSAPPPAEAQVAPDAAGDAGASEGVRLFRRVKPGTPIVEKQQAVQQRKDGCHTDGQDSSRPLLVTELRHLDSPTKARCHAAAVQPEGLLRAAQAAAQQAAQHVASPPGWLPGNDEPSRWSHRRKRRAAKLAAEAEAWRLQHA